MMTFLAHHWMLIGALGVPVVAVVYIGASLLVCQTEDQADR